MTTGKNYIGDNLSSNSSVTFQTFNPKLNIKNEIFFSDPMRNINSIPKMNIEIK